MPGQVGDQGLKTLFSRYYKDFKSVEPDQISKREVGYIPFSGTMTRHLAFKTHRDLENFVTGIVPRHLYYSSTYYQWPLEKKMIEKGWMGAELIFDLDADHLKGASEMTYEQILRNVRDHTFRLVDEFLIGLAGFREDELRIYFSGGRGYHVHVVSEKVYSLNSDARREISNMIRGEGLNAKDLILNINNYGKLSGWAELVDREVTDTYKGIANGEYPKFLAENDRAAISSSLEQAVSLNGIVKKRKDILAQPGKNKYRLLNQLDREVVSRITDDVREKHACEIDEPVTTDVHRLIRFPFSLHGKTGLMVKPLTFSDLADYDPLTEAIPESSDVKARIEVKRKLKIRMRGENFEINEGEMELPGYVAGFCAGMGAAQILSIIN